MAKVLITGGAGFIGSNLAEVLVQEGHTVKVFDNLCSGRKENLDSFKKDVEFIEGDIRDLDALNKAMKGMEWVSHHAALRAVFRSVEQPIETNEVNTNGLMNVLVAARDAGVKRVVTASSSSVYGNNPDLPKVETMTPAPISPYAASKIMGEYLCNIFFNLYGLEAVSLRYFNVFGPRQNPGSIYSAVIPIFVDCIDKGQSPDIHGDGEQSRDFSYIDNVVLANKLAFLAKGAPGESFNIACHERYSVNDIFNGICKILGKKITPNHVAPRAGDVKHTYADITKAQKVLGYEVKVRFDEGLKKTVDWFLNEYKK